jgi:hypothetical protein
MKITRVGWVGKCISLEDVIHRVIKSYVAEEKGDEWEWPEQYWPPRKVSITVEDVEDK